MFLFPMIPCYIRAFLVTFNMASSRVVGVVRQFSTSAVRAALVQAPIQVFGLEGRYAHALYSAASKEKKLDVVEKELLSVQTNIKKDVKLKEFFANPSIKRAEKKDVLTQVLQSSKVSNLTTNLMGAMVENGRIGKMDAVLVAFGKLMAAHRGEVVCTVTTAKPLDAAQLKELKTSLDGFLNKGETLMLQTEVDPSIIGGMVVNIGDKYVDMSMTTKLNAYTNLIKQAI